MTDPGPAAIISRMKSAIAEVIVGYAEAVDLLLTGLLSNGHVLIEDVPGVGKTMLARTLAVITGLDFKRIQFTPDLLPSDVTGVNTYDPKKGEFHFQPGPVFTNILLADEINRATPRTQSALLECMQERQVTVGGVTRPVPRPFITVATQNPVEMSGTFPLPSAQLDRFLMRVFLGYPSEVDEAEIVRRYRSPRDPEEMVEAVVTPDDIVRMSRAATEVHLRDDLRDYIIACVRKTRKSPGIELGASPRSAVMLAGAARSLAFLNGRDYVIPDDVQRLMLPVLGHRLIASEESWLRGREGEAVLTDILESVPVPGE
ncbi:MAG: MoxR family ATPase [Bacillota bacterium]